VANALGRRKVLSTSSQLILRLFVDGVLVGGWYKNVHPPEPADPSDGSSLAIESFVIEKHQREAGGGGPALGSND